VPWKQWAYLEKVLSADFQLYLQNQTVPQFTNTAQRDSQWTTPPTGAVCITADTLTLWVYTGTAWISYPTARVYTIGLAGGGIAGSELAVNTVTVPPQPRACTVVLSAFHNYTNDTTADTFQARIRAGNGIAGAIVAAPSVRHAGGTGVAMIYSVPCTTPQALAANTQGQWTFTMQRTGGTGTATPLANAGANMSAAVYMN
jgi:hypothetical protein